MDAPVSSDFTQEILGWVPTHYSLLEDLQHGDYFLPINKSAFIKN